MKKGVYAASITPLSADLNVAVTKLSIHCKWLLANGCDGVALFGTTGEANSFSVRERMAVVDQLADSGLDMERVLLGTGCCALPDTLELTRHALQHKIYNVLLLPPFYYKNVSDVGLYTYFSGLIEKLASEKIRIFLYHFPKMTGVPFSHDLIGRLYADFPHNIAGIKDSSGDSNNMAALITKYPGFQVYSGTERYLYRILQAGGQGCISATVNVTCRIAGQIYRDWQSGANAEDQQELLTKFRSIFEQFPFIAALKEIVAWYTNDPEWLNIRPPHVRLSPADGHKLTEYIKDSALFSDR